ncbi:MAG: hypothetical protein ACRET3_07160 [Burkholderiales bacterium]
MVERVDVAWPGFINSHLAGDHVGDALAAEDRYDRARCPSRSQ